MPQTDAHPRPRARSIKETYDVSTETESHATITSPIDGVVSDRLVEQGEAVKDGAVLLTRMETLNEDSKTDTVDAVQSL